ncbi:MAG: hypothetical protein KIT33_01945 [Candidatus Kapabacteria bacterium]|nr:hypothetical protein [Ignavibacteriota bacterium]MCW5883714.1 hypothetical protein [Candidatus Kapabacteria bacterium]
MSKVLFLILIFISSISAVISSDITAVIESDTNNVLIGEPVNLEIKIISGKNYKFNFPVFTDTLGKLEILDLFPTDSIHADSKFGISKRLTVTSFEAGYINIEPIVITYTLNDVDDFRIITTNSLSLEFATVEVDTASSEIRDIKPPLQAPLTLEEMLPYIGLILGLLVIYYLIIYIFGRKPNLKEKQIPKYDPKIPADLEALEALQRLERENLWQSGKFKLYHSKLTDILRVYIHRRYHLNALEMTSGELVHDVSMYESNINSLDILKTILEIADLAKFAKYEPLSDENVSSMTNAIKFVNNTKVVDITKDDDIEIQEDNK